MKTTMRYAGTNRIILRKTVFRTILLMFFSIFASGCTAAQKTAGLPVEGMDNVRAFFKKEARIIHACGLIESEGTEYTYTNSQEALHNVLDTTDRKIIEIDFKKTYDGQVICGHYWKDFEIDGVPSESELTMEQVNSARMFGKFTPLTLTHLIDTMRSNENFLVVTYCKDDWNIEIVQKIKEAAPDLQERFIIQIYSEKEYEPVKEMGFDNIIFTLYLAPDEEKTPQELIRFAGENELVGITFWDYMADDPSFYTPLREGLPDITLMVHTVNDPEEMERYYSMGIDAIYTDQL